MIFDREFLTCLTTIILMLDDGWIRRSVISFVVKPFVNWKSNPLPLITSPMYLFFYVYRDGLQWIIRLQNMQTANCFVLCITDHLARLNTLSWIIVLRTYSIKSPFKLDKLNQNRFIYLGATINRQTQINVNFINNLFLHRWLIINCFCSCIFIFL